jgi:hypothetical protein
MRPRWILVSRCTVAILCLWGTVSMAGLFRIAFRMLPLVLISASWAQSSQMAQKATKKEKPGSSTERHLVVVKTVEAPRELLANLAQPLVCDDNGNIYFQTDLYAVSGIHKLNAHGERTALFQPSAKPALKADLSVSFAIDSSGELYQLVDPPEITRYIFIYKGDGTYKASIKLQPGFPWIPSSLAVLPQGNLFISGQEYDRDHKTE